MSRKPNIGSMREAMLKFCSLIIFFSFSTVSSQTESGQTEMILLDSGETKYINLEPDCINCTDDKGLKQGYWIYYGKDRPEAGYPSEGKIEEGLFVDNRKCGVWIKYYKDGKTPRLTGYYVNSRPNGPYQKFSVNGSLMEEGVFILGNRIIGTECKYYENGQLSYYRVSFDGIIDTVYCFARNGDTIDCYKPDIDQKITDFETHEYQAPFYLPNGDIDTSWQKKSPVNYPIEETKNKSACMIYGQTMNGEYDFDGYNKVYTTSKKLWMDGVFRDGYLWEGKIYIYDSDGLLIKIEIWKDGKYQSDQK